MKSEFAKALLQALEREHSLVPMYVRFAIADADEKIGEVKTVSDAFRFRDVMLESHAKDRAVGLGSPIDDSAIKCASLLCASGIIEEVVIGSVNAKRAKHERR